VVAPEIQCQFSILWEAGHGSSNVFGDPIKRKFRPEKFC